MSVDITIDVGSILGVATGSLSPEARQLVRKQLTGIKNEVKSFVLSVWPVDSAASLQDWEIRVIGLTLVLRNPVDYAVHVHRAGQVGKPVWLEIQTEANALVDAAIGDMQFTIEQNPKRTGTQDAPTFVSSPAVTFQTLINATLFRAKQRALERVPTLTRDGIRNRIDNRVPLRGGRTRR